jgi:hypothetical protein
MTITFDIKPEILKKYSEEEMKVMFEAFLITLNKMDYSSDNFIPTEEFLDFRKVNWNEFPEDVRINFEKKQKAFHK